MIGIQCQSNDEVDLVENVDIKLTGMGEATALAILEHLLVHHMSYILRSLESQATSTDNWDIEIPELKEALSPNSYKHYVGMKKNILLSECNDFNFTVDKQFDKIYLFSLF